MGDIGVLKTVVGVKMLKVKICCYNCLQMKYEEVEELKAELEVLRDGTVDQETHTNTEGLESELKTLRTELGQVWEMLKIKVCYAFCLLAKCILTIALFKLIPL